MIYSLQGEVSYRDSAGFAVIETGGIGWKVFMLPGDLDRLAVGDRVSVFCHHHVAEAAMDLYGFSKASSLSLFELLISVSGVGPRSAMAILAVGTPDQVSAAIAEGRADVLSRAPGVGSRIASRIILDLKGKIQHLNPPADLSRMDADADILEALVGLGYRKQDAKAAVARAGEGSFQERLKTALRLLSASLS